MAVIESAEEFVRLRCSENMEDYHRAAHEEASEAVWRLVIEKYPDMKIWVVRNKTVPLTILKHLAEDDSETVRTDVAMKRKLSRELFEKLASDTSVSVRHAIGNNPKVPMDILQVLADDSDDWLREKVREKLADQKQ